MEIVIEWCIAKKKAYPPHWIEIRDRMYFNFDSENQRVIEFSGYHGQSIKQADTDLLTFPIEWPFSPEIKRNNMLYYFEKLPANHIMMGAAIFSIIACELGMKEKAWEYFIDQFAHFHPENFLIASESPNNDCWPFLTGIAGFLSNLLYGFGGIRIRKEGLLFSPFLPPQLPEIKFNQIFVQGSRFEYQIQNQGAQFILKNQGSACKITLYFRNKRIYNPINTIQKIQDIEASNDESCYSLNFGVKESITFQLK
jgi:trehalose/maltose hydrolase-like predicted phosphorylase